MTLNYNEQKSTGFTIIRNKSTFLTGSRCIYGQSAWSGPPSFLDYQNYVGIQKDPLGKTNDMYHVREYKDYDTPLRMEVDTYSVFFRVNDLAPVYTSYTVAYVP